MDLFEYMRTNNMEKESPLAARLRPTTLEEVVGQIMGPEVTLVDSGAQAARQLKASLTERDALCGRRQGSITLYASDITGDFGALAPQFLREPAPKVLEVDIDKY